MVRYFLITMCLLIFAVLFIGAEVDAALRHLTGRG